jgi:o-succinylbenzoate---CoA ligase
MLFFDFSKDILPTSENSYFQSVIDFVTKWQSGIEVFEVSTSGSTGIPKLIKIKRKQMIASAQLTISTFGLEKQDHLLCCLNINFIAGKMMLVRAMELGARLIVVEPNTNPFLGINQTYTFDFAALVPMQIQAILENETTKNYLEKLSCLKNIIIGGAQINNKVLKEIEKLQINCFATYGMTETVSHIAIMPLNGKNKSDFFQVLHGIKVQVNTRNCLSISGLCTDNIWVNTNDIVELENGNSFKLIGRANRVVNSGGIKLYLDILEKEIENTVFGYFQKQVKYFLCGLDDETLGEKLILVVEAENPEINTTCQDIFKNSILSKYKIPKMVVFLPKFVITDSGKIDFVHNLNTIKAI